MKTKEEIEEKISENNQKVKRLEEYWDENEYILLDSEIDAFADKIDSLTGEVSILKWVLNKDN